MLKPIISIAALVACSVCNSLGWSMPIDSAFVAPNASGELVGVVNYFDRDPKRMVSQTTGNSYIYGTRFDPDAGERSYAGIVPGADVSTLPASGTLTMSGAYRADWKTYSTVSTNNIQLERQGSTSGTITLVADIGAGTLVGTSEDAGELTVNGTFSGSALSGTVTHNGVQGPLQGLIGSNEAIGVFHGNDSKSIHAGGFIVN